MPHSHFFPGVLPPPTALLGLEHGAHPSLKIIFSFTFPMLFKKKRVCQTSLSLWPPGTISYYSPPCPSLSVSGITSSLFSCPLLSPKYFSQIFIYLRNTISSSKSLSFRSQHQKQPFVHAFFILHFSSKAVSTERSNYLMQHFLKKER